MDALSSLPSVADTALPADVRSGSAADKRAYKSALGFEQMLVSQLVKQAMPKDADEDQDPAAGTYQGQIQDAFAAAITTAGGLGLAKQLYAQMRPQEGTAR
jgi:Rod binding domain-containing protein